MLKVICFSKGETSQKDFDIIDKAVQRAKCDEIDFEIVNADQIRSMISGECTDKRSIYVCFPFEGKIFETMKTQGYRIVGPQCVISCLTLEIPVPKQPYPIANVAMLGCSVCCSSMKKDERTKTHNLVLCMGGEVATDFTTSVTHLVAKEVGSNKYIAAFDNNVPVLSPAWVHSCWERSKYAHYVANTNDVIVEFKLPIFKGCTICVTGINFNTRQKIKSLAEENGGIYSGELNVKTCTHLLVEKPHGEKYSSARRWKLHCISPTWFFDCLEIGHWIDENPYYVEPNSDTTVNRSVSEKSSVQNTFRESITHDKSQKQSFSSKAAEVAARSAENFKQKQEEQALESQYIIKTFESVSLKINNLLFSEETHFYLDGCYVYLCNKPGSVLDCCRKIINNGGATRHNSLNNTITHIVLWDQVPTEVQQFLLNSNKESLPHIVSPQWLLDCFNSKELKSEEAYSLLDSQIKIDKQLQEKFVKPIVQPQLYKPNTASSLHLNFEDEAADDSTLLNQYRSDNHESTRLSQLNSNRKCFDEEITNGKDDTFEEVPSDVLQGKTFAIQRFNSEQVQHIKKLITDFSGNVTKVLAVSDYIIVPMSYDKKMTISKKELTMCWLEQSIEANDLKSPSSSFLFRPFFLSETNRPLHSCVITVSQYTGMERQHLSHLTELLGGIMQEHFVRHNNKTMKASTHLVLIKPEGPKYNASLKWGIPCVSKKWLFQCAKVGKLLPESDFPVTGVDTEEEEDNHNFADIAANKLNDFTETGKNISFILSNRGGSILESVAVENKTAIEETVPNNIMEVDFTIKETTFVPDKDYTKKDTDFSLFNKMIAQERSTPIDVDEVDQVENVSLVTKDKTLEKNSQESQASLNLPPFELNKSRFSFDVSGTLAAMQSPNVSGSQDSPASLSRRKSVRSRASLPLDIQFTEALQNAVDKYVPERIQTNCPDKNEDVFHAVSGVFSGVVVVVSKKLAHRQTELHTVVNLLGGESRFLYDPSCTHFVHQGNLGDKSKDFSEAKKSKKFLVSPYWIEACANANEKVPETKYPVTYNPRLSIELSSNKPDTYQSKENGVKSTTIDTTIITPVFKNARTSSVVEHEGDLKNVTEKTEEVIDNDDVSIISDAEKLDFHKKMTEIMEATKAPRKRERRQTNVSLAKHDSSSNLNNTRKTRSRNSSQKSMESSLSSNSEPKTSKVGSEFLYEHSQGDYITYDDPAGRIERERILAQLKQASPSQDIESLHYPLEKFIPDNNLDRVKEMDEPIQKLNELERIGVTRNAQGNGSISAEPLTKKPILIQSIESLTQPQVELPMRNTTPKREFNNLLEDKEVTCNNSKEKKEEKYIFLLSGLSGQEKIDYGALIEKLGGVLHDVQYFNVQCTHVVVNNPSRVEKYLASLASGKWVLHKSFLEASRENNDFVNEEDHEWGSQPNCNSFAASAKRWRIDLTEKRKTNPNAAAFNGWIVLLCIESPKQPGFKRILEAGGGKVLADRPPFEKIDGATHAFIGDKKLAAQTKVDFEKLQSSGVWILRPEYISDYLTVSPRPPVFNYVLHDIGECGGKTITCGKRKVCSDVSLQQKKSRYNGASY